MDKCHEYGYLLEASMCASKTVVYRSTSGITYNNVFPEWIYATFRWQKRNLFYESYFICFGRAGRTYMLRKKLLKGSPATWTENHLSCFQIRSPVWNSFHGRDQLNTQIRFLEIHGRYTANSCLANCPLIQTAAEFPAKITDIWLQQTPFSTPVLTGLRMRA